jgi:hypothetical protein
MEKIEIQIERLIQEQQRTNQLLAMLIEALADDGTEQPQRDMDGNLCLPSDDH